MPKSNLFRDKITLEPPYTVEAEDEGVTCFTLDGGLEITRYGKYIGLYMEDCSDEFVTNVMMIEIYNGGASAVQYAKITLTGPAGDAVFTLTTLLPGDRMIVLEAGRKPYSEQDVYTEAAACSVAWDCLRFTPEEFGIRAEEIVRQTGLAWEERKKV